MNLLKPCAHQRRRRVVAPAAVTDRRVLALRAALGFLQLPPRAPGATRIIIGLCVAFQVACTGTDVRRVPSPGYSLDAVLVELNYGATSRFSYEIHIVPRAALYAAAISS